MKYRPRAKDGLLADELVLIQAAPLVTGRYAGWRPEFGVPIRATQGMPRGWKHGELIRASAITPSKRVAFGKMPESEAHVEFVGQLQQRSMETVLFLGEVARRFPGQRLVVLCFENVIAGEVCHRRWFADWMEAEYGMTVPELAYEGHFEQLQFDKNCERGE
jgi:hypothetical protein